MDSENSTTNTTIVNSTETTCSNEAWLVFPVTYLVLYILGITLSSIAFGVGLMVERGKPFAQFKMLLDSLRRLKQLARKLVSGDNILSQVLISVALICNLIYMALAFQRAYQPDTRCFSSLTEVPDLAVEVVISPLLIIFFVIRLLASDNLVLFWLKIHTIVDVVSLPNIFISLSLGQDWLDTKTLRFVWLTQITDVLRFLPFIHSQDTIEAVALMMRLLALWMGATGLIHLLETTGDPWRNFSNQQSNTFLEYAYFTMVTMSTVGYGDYFAMTDIGRAFMTLFIIAGIAFFAFALPNLVNLVIDYYQRTQWSKFDTTRVPRHILVCGHITTTTVSDFLKDFLHKDRGDSKTHVLFMHTERPGAELRVVLRSYYTRVQYVMGSVLNAKDLAKAKIDDHECKAVFILAEKHCDFPEREDQENLLRLVSIKNTTSNIPVTIQVLLSSSKDKVKYIPRTSSDTVICLTELKLGLLAQSCLCPGLSTLVGNLFYASEALSEVEGWQQLYGQGISHEVYITPFSHAFDDMAFYDAAQLCYEKLGLILLAVEDRQSGRFYISPSPAAHTHLQLRGADPEQPNTVMLGYFIGEDQSHVDQVSWYGNDTELKMGVARIPLLPLNGKKAPIRRRCSFFTRVSSPVFSVTSYGDLYQVAPQPMEDCLVNKDSTDHVLLCVFADDSSSALYLRNFLEPLRRSSIPEKDLMPVTIVAHKKFLEKEWPCISCFPKVMVLPGSPLDWDILSRACVEVCQVCVILTASKIGEEQEEAAMRDKEAILCSLMIHNHHNQLGISSKQPLIITDLIEESNVQFLDIEDEDSDDGRIYIAQPFACGEAFAASLFDSITSSTFHSPGTLFLVEQLISASRNERCSTQSSIKYIPMSRFPSHATFKQLYTHMLTQHKTPVAISRLLAPPPSEGGNTLAAIVPMQPGHLAAINSQRYVVTAPPPNTPLLPSDYILVLEESVTTDSTSHY